MGYIAVMFLEESYSRKRAIFSKFDMQNFYCRNNKNIFSLQLMNFNKIYGTAPVIILLTFKKYFIA